MGRLADGSDLFTAAPRSSGWGCLGSPRVLCSSWKADVQRMTVQMAQCHCCHLNLPQHTHTQSRGQRHTNKLPGATSSVKISPFFPFETFICLSVATVFHANNLICVINTHTASPADTQTHTRPAAIFFPECDPRGVTRRTVNQSQKTLRNSLRAAFRMPK